MKHVFALVLFAMTTSAQAQLLAPRGSKATLHVEYLYTADGTSGRRNGTDAIHEWKVRRVMNLTAHYTAEEPAAIGVLHQSEAQTAALDKKVNQAQAFGRKMEPTVNDMMKIMDRCGENEACIEKAVAEYANTMNVDEMRANQAQATAMFKPDAPRYQLWKPVSQSGTYEVDELTTFQVFEIGCTLTQVCKRTVTTRGKGTLPPSDSASLLEIDSAKPDLAAKMPIPLQELKVESKVVSNVPDDDFQVAPLLPVRLLKDAQTLTLAIADGKLPASGTTSIKSKGTGAESGTLTVKWTFKRQ